MNDAGTLRGIEHIGITVPDHAAAVVFFQEALGAQVLFSLTDKQREPLSGQDLMPRNGLLAQTAIVAVSMLRLGNGPNLEVFEIDLPSKPDCSVIAAIGISHFSITVDDIDTACARFAQAGGCLLEGPYELTGQEQGPGNRGRFGLTPWGLLIEFEQLPSAVACDDGCATTRWIPEVSA